MRTLLTLAIALPGWVQYARTVRGSVMVEKNKDYVAAFRKESGNVNPNFFSVGGYLVIQGRLSLGALVAGYLGWQVKSSLPSDPKIRINREAFDKLARQARNRRFQKWN